MIRCDQTRDRLLEADGGELAGIGPSALAAHVRDCPACAELGGQILAGQEALSGVLTAMAGGVGTSVDPAAARGEVVAQRRRRRVVWRVTAPLAAAAVGALALFRASAPTPEAVLYVDVPEWAQPLALGARGTVVTPVADERVAVMPTQNPNITVVWFIK